MAETLCSSSELILQSLLLSNVPVSVIDECTETKVLIFLRKE